MSATTTRSRRFFPRAPMIPRSSHARGDLRETGSIDYAHTYALDLTAKAKSGHRER